MTTRKINVEEMLSSYIEAALWSSFTDDGEPLDKQHSHSSISAETLAEMREDVEAFAESNASDILLWDGENTSPEEQSGHDFWLTRNWHGAGFWETEWTSIESNPGVRLDVASKGFGDFTLYVGDDGKIHGE